MLQNVKIVNESEISSGQSLKNVIRKIFMEKDFDKIYYSMELTPKSGLHLDFSEFAKKPLFLALTWIKDENLNFGKSLGEAPTIQIGKLVKNTHVVHHLSCYNLTEIQLDAFLDEVSVKNVFVVRGDLVNQSQKYLYASQLITEVRSKTSNVKPDLIIMGAGYPEVHPEAESLDVDLDFLKKKVDNGVNVIITQICFSSNKIVEFIKKCRDLDIKVPIIPGLYIPRTFQELKRILNFTKVNMSPEIFQHFQSIQQNPEGFEIYSLTFMENLIQEIQKNASEHVACYHFFSLNNFSMIQKFVKKVGFEQNEENLV